jgi:dihydropteroate synthase
MAEVWRHARGEIDCTRGRLIGIVNATPDSFTDQGAHFGTAASVARGHEQAAAGADIVEVGGESLRYKPAIDPEVEITRVTPVIERLARELDRPVAVDTFKPRVAEAAIAAGASILNDPTGLREPGMAEVAAAGRVGVVLSHYFGPPKVRPTSFPDVDVPVAVVDWALRAIEDAVAAGVDPERIVVDPGVGLGKSPEQDLDLLHRLREVVVGVGRPVFVPISNKKVIGAVTGALPKERIAGTAAGLAWSRLQGASIFRVHDVAFMREVLQMTEALADGAPAEWHWVAK